MRKNRILWIVAVAVAVWAGRFTAPAPMIELGPAAAEAGEALAVDDGDHFVSTDGGNAYLWRRDGNRITLVSHCKVLETTGGQATYVSSPGVERGS